MTSSSKYKARCIINTALIKLNYSGSYVKYILMTVAITINITAANKSITLFLGSSPYRKYSAYNKDLEINLAFYINISILA